MNDYLTKKYIIEDRERTKQELLKRKATIIAELGQIDSRLAIIDEAEPLPNLNKPFRELSVKEQSIIYNIMGESVFKWFAERTYHYGLEYSNKDKTLQDYINEGEPAGKIRFFPELTVRQEDISK